jgi:tellurite resistance protein TehA-like permease
MTSPQSDLSARRARLRRDRIPIDKLGDLDAFELRRVTSAGMGMLHRRPPRTTLSDVVREFALNWFTVTMGTGAFALALNQFPLPLPGASDIAGGLWLLDLMLFVLFTILYAARWIFFFDGARQIFWHSVLSMFLGAIPMGLATIINGLLVFGVPFFGKSAVSVGHALWWADAAMSVGSGLLVPFLMFTIQHHSLERMTAVWLLPIVAAEVAAASGALLVPHLSA